MQYDIANETIDFQDGKLFKNLTAQIEEIRSVNTGTNVPILFSEPFEKLSKLIQSETGLDVNFESGDGFAVLFPTMSNNHTLLDNYYKELLEQYKTYNDSFADVRLVLKNMNAKIINGSVSLNDSMVTGVFTKIPITMIMVNTMFNKNCNYTSAEVAAIMLHEIGHIFTGMEFLSRTITTNQVLASMTRALDKTVPSNDRDVIFAKGIELLKLDDDQRQALLNNKDKKTLAIIVLDANIKLSVSELGKSIYDVNSCEQLADMFAARHGAGREMVTALDKLYTEFDNDGSISYNGYVLRASLIVGLFGLPNIIVSLSLVGAVWFIGFCFMTLLMNKECDTYDSPKARANRIKMQNIELLKDKKISKERKQSVIETNIIIDKVIENYSDNLGFYETLAYYLKPSYRNAHKYQLLQQDLEKLAGNSLFETSAKLSLLS